jgi:TPR repeat protein
MAPSERARQVMTAARTDPAAAHCLAGWYRGGEEGLFQSPGLAFRWELRAAEGGHLEAQSLVARAYKMGAGVVVDVAAATAWFGKAAERGYRSAQFNFGVALELGQGTPQNYELAATWFQRAVDQGDADDLVHLGIFYDNGDGVKQDHAHANTLYREALKKDSDNIHALMNLGSNCFEASGVKECLATALSFWQRAADLGHAAAQANVGKAYVDGVGGYAKNIQLARQYIKASAAQGNVDAVAELKKWNACAHCGAAAAPKVCSGCITTRYCRYCDAECQLAQWTGPADVHRAHCGGRCCWFQAVPAPRRTDCSKHEAA